MKNHTLTGPKGFRVSAVKAGIKASGKLDLGLIIADKPCVAVGMFTQNKIVASAVTVSKEHLSNNKAQAIYVNAGNANACTGQKGHNDSVTIAEKVAELFELTPENVLVASTGIIGEMLPMGNVLNGIEKAAEKIDQGSRGAKRFAKAIMTTDTKVKTAYAEVKLGSKIVRLAATVKGAGMIAPNMATMLCFITTDVNISPALLKRALKDTVEITFNKVTIDKHESTNDSIFALASGLAENNKISKQDLNYRKFAKALWEICDDLAQQMAADGEGANNAVTVKVAGAANATDAHNAVRAIVDSPLVRCAFHGADPNWGRIVSAVGFSGAKFNESKLSCKIADTFVYRNGKPADFDFKALSKQMKEKEWQVLVNLGAGKHEDFCYTCDLSRDYITINADYHT